MSVAFYLTAASFRCAPNPRSTRRPLVERPFTGHGNLPGRFTFKRKEHCMSAQVVQAIIFKEPFPIRVIHSGQLSQISSYMIRAPFLVHHGPEWGTLPGNPNNEYRRRRRHRCRLSKNTRTLHGPHRGTRDRLRALVPDP